VSIEGWGEAPPSTPLTRWRKLGANLDLWLVDHGFLRFFYANQFKLPGPLYRTNQPSVKRIFSCKKKLSVKTIINLRGYNPSQGRYQLEAKACEDTGITLINTRVHSRGLPTAKQINLLKELIEQLETPALAHCKSGADRAGIFSVLYCHFRLGQPIQQAKDQLHWKFGHFRSSKTGVLDHFFNSYIEYRRNWEAKNSSLQAPEFIEWVNNDYDRDRLEKEFEPRGFANFWIDWILRRE
jgi:protein tyrosine phosphatase (PTP) superfamily phosphohydrolase (DUF442 family)